MGSKQLQSNLRELVRYDSFEIDDSMLEILMATKTERVKKMHPFAITPPQNEAGRWQTYYKDASGKRKCIKASNEKELLEKLVVIYYSDLYIDNLTFHELFLEWLDYKRNITNSINTIKRHEQHYRKYFEPSQLHSQKISQINSLLLEKECNRIVRDFNLSRKEWTNAKTILLGMFEYAVRQKYLNENPMRDMRILVKYRQVVKKTGRSQTYNTEELSDLNTYLEQQFSETNDPVFLAVKINFLLGLRVGELVALKWSDIEENSLHVIREEIRDQVSGTYEVVEHTKTHQDRFVALIPKAHEILERIEPQSEFIFSRGNIRITSRQIAYVLEKYAQRRGIRTKSSHKIRKTYASNLATKGVPLDAVRELLGHNDLETTLGYIYNPLTEKETIDLIEKAL